ncbi:unnamed protein product [Ectocarpus sp. 12 AP-2014]
MKVSMSCRPKRENGRTCRRRIRSDQRADSKMNQAICIVNEISCSEFGFKERVRMHHNVLLHAPSRCTFMSHPPDSCRKKKHRRWSSFLPPPSFCDGHFLSRKGSNRPFLRSSGRSLFTCMNRIQPD